jgi:hypothetical protein
MARHPIRPTDRTSGALAIPTMRADTTSGITVMRIALIHSVPSGRMISTADRSAGDGDIEMAIPAASPAARPIRTFVVSDTGKGGR